MLTIDNVSVRRGKAATLRNITLSTEAGQTLAVVGESGAGKSTLIAAILGLVNLTSGGITWNGAPVRSCRPSLVMQEPRAAFNPAISLQRSVMEPLTGRGLKLSAGRLERLSAELDLPQELLERRPDEVSIGQAQRVGILRALIAEPSLVLFDEPLSALDAVTQKQTARLISQLQAEEGFAAILVTHDLGYAAAFGDQIAVLRNGRLEEVASTQDFIQSPKTEYGQSLCDAAFALGSLERDA